MSKEKLPTIIKYAATIIIIGGSFVIHNSKWAVLAGALELLLIFFTTDFLPEKGHINRIVNSILILLLILQYFVLVFGGSYIKYVMLANLGSIKDLSGKATEYFIAGAIVIGLALLPIGKTKIKGRTIGLLVTAALYVLLILNTEMIRFSPAASYIKLANEWLEVVKIEKRVEVVNVDEDFYRKTITDAVQKPSTLPNKPNIIIIFIEGVSESVIEDERSIMPNAKALKNDALFFENYFNHTAPTYKGIIGQLTSGYQRNNLDRSGLTSVQSILKDEGYNTTFVNVEPNNKEFTDYLFDLGFDSIVTDDTKATGLADSITDKDAYDLLWKTINVQESDQPFMIGIYTLGTHVSFYSTDEQYGSGDNAYLSKFYNSDYWFGEFFKKFKNSSFSENTVLIFTTDHATWEDNDYMANFKDSLDKRGDFTDTIPFYIYYNGVDGQAIDVKGRNSLGLAPTICDFLDIEHDNYFLGESLFNNGADTYFDTMTSYEGTRVTTRNGFVEEIKENEDEEFLRLLEQYYSVKKESAEKKGLKDRKGLG